MHGRMQPQPLETREPLVTRQARVAFYVQFRLLFLAVREAVAGYVLGDTRQAVIIRLRATLAVLFQVLALLVRVREVVVGERVEADDHVFRAGPAVLLVGFVFAGLRRIIVFSYR